MAIDVFWQTEMNDVVEKWPDGKATINHLIYEHGTDGTSCLRFVDPYGYTNFNHRQIPELISDLMTVSGRHESCEVAAKIDSLIVFLKRTEGSKAHVAFYGD